MQGLSGFFVVVEENGGNGRNRQTRNRSYSCMYSKLKVDWSRPWNAACVAKKPQNATLIRLALMCLAFERLAIPKWQCVCGKCFGDLAKSIGFQFQLAQNYEILTHEW